MKDFDTIWSEFKKNRDVFPHIRTDYLKRQIKNNNVIYQDGVILIIGKYKRKGTLGNVQYFKDCRSKSRHCNPIARPPGSHEARIIGC